MVAFPQLTNVFLNNPYIHSLLIFALSLITAKLIVYISQKIISKLTEKTKTKIDDLIRAKTTTPFSLILVLLGIKLSITPLNLAEVFVKTADYIIWSLVIVLVTY